MTDIDILIHKVYVLTWLHAELQWKFNEHRHNVTGCSTDWGPTLPHWK